jgi:hypothetical protein
MRAAADSDLAAVPAVVLEAAVVDAAVVVVAVVVAAVDVAADAEGAVPAHAAAAADAGLSTDNTLPSATGVDATSRNRPMPARLP